jgi:hypothetical protein
MFEKGTTRAMQLMAATTTVLALALVTCGDSDLNGGGNPYEGNWTFETTFCSNGGFPDVRVDDEGNLNAISGVRTLAGRVEDYGSVLGEYSSDGTGCEGPFSSDCASTTSCSGIFSPDSVTVLATWTMRK